MHRGRLLFRCSIYAKLLHIQTRSIHLKPDTQAHDHSNVAQAGDADAFYKTRPVFLLLPNLALKSCCSIPLPIGQATLPEMSCFLLANVWKEQSSQLLRQADEQVVYPSL